MEKTAQDILLEEFQDDDSSGKSNETLELLKFMRDSGTSLTSEQAKAVFLLQENGLEDIAVFMMNSRKFVTPNSLFFKTIDKLTLADRIKGNAKFSHLMKASANPAESLKASDLQAQGMSKREIDKL